MATSGYFDGAKSTYGWYLRLEYNVVSSTSVNLTLKIYDGTGESYNNNANSCYYVIQGTKTYQTIVIGLSDHQSWSCCFEDRWR